MWTSLKLVSLNQFLTFSKEFYFSQRPQPNFIELLTQKLSLNHVLLLSTNEKDTTIKCYMRHGILAGNLNLASIILLCLGTLCGLGSSMKLGAVLVVHLSKQNLT